MPFIRDASLQLLDQSVNVIGVPRASSSSREDRCVPTADVIILEWVEASQDESTLTCTHTGHFLDALMRDDELSLVSSQAPSLSATVPLTIGAERLHMQHFQWPLLSSSNLN